LGMGRRVNGLLKFCKAKIIEYGQNGDATDSVKLPAQRGSQIYHGTKE